MKFWNFQEKTLVFFCFLRNLLEVLEVRHASKTTLLWEHLFIRGDAFNMCTEVLVGGSADAGNKIFCHQAVLPFLFILTLLCTGQQIHHKLIKKITMT